ncbi:MAG: hypothetical protein K5649_03795 [Lachnospiraceae bacterium]|nr:hypothetical protein [Lachnospiraceae bacterium]
MTIQYDLHGNTMHDLYLAPEVTENISELYNLSQELLVMNPVILFADKAKAGVFNNLSDAEYEKMLCHIKAFDTLFWDDTGRGNKYINIFMFVEKLMNALLLCIDQYEHKLGIEVKKR